MTFSTRIVGHLVRRIGLSALVALAGLCLAPNAGAQVAYFTNGHMDFRFAYDAAASGTNQLNLVLRYHPSDSVFTNHQFYIVGTTNAKKTIPNSAFDFLGPVGAPVWILPKLADSLRPDLGISAEDLPHGVFDNPKRLELVSAEGPGNFFVYDVLGTPVPEIIATNGVISPAHRHTEVIDHSHRNWAFSTNGLYRITFRGVGSPAGTGTNLVGRDVAFAFQLLPLRPWENWVSTNWLPATDATIAGPGADPDGDNVVNVMEYALGLDPNAQSTNGFPTASLVMTNGQTYGALSFTRVKAATDLVYEPSARSSLTDGAWNVLTNVMTVVDHGETEAVTVRDDEPVGAHAARFLQLRVRLNYP